MNFKRTVNKVLSLTMVFVLTIFVGTTPVAFADSSEKSYSVVDALNASISQIEGFDANVMALNQEEENKISERLEARLAKTEFYSKLENEGFVEDNEIKFKPAKAVNVYDSRNSVYQFMKLYVSNSGEKLLASFMYDESTGSLLRLDSKKLTLKGELEDFYDFSEYNKPRLRAAFTFNGKSFACSMAGLVACSSYCFGWGLVNPLAGLTCEGVCGVAMAAACATGD